MKAITVKQPWATAIRAHAFVTCGKDVENRSRLSPWQTGVGERIGIHAGKGWDSNADTLAPRFLRLWEVDLVRRLNAEMTSYPTAMLLPYTLPKTHAGGVIIATALLQDVHPGKGCECSPWADPDAEAHLALTHVLTTMPVPCRGALGLWTVPDSVRDGLSDGLAA